MSEIKVNKISPRSGTDVQLGDSGDTFTIPSGATINNQGTATNFGATGSASWVTTVKTSGFTAVAGEGYFVNTTGGAVSVNLPAGTAGAVVAIKDYAKTFDTNACTLVQNGSDKIGGSTVNAKLTTEGIAVTLVFIDSTQGWLVTDSGLQTEAPTPQFITATGGTITTVCTNFKVHTFTGPGTFTVCSVGNAAGSNSVDYLVAAGGGGGGVGPSGANMGGGGGGGGYRESSGAASGCYSASPVGACVSALPVTATGFPIVVGAGGTGIGPSAAPGPAGSNSSFSTITSTGGGGGGSGGPGATGGSGGGAGGGGSYSGGAGNTPPVSPAQGTNGGDGGGTGAGGGGGGATGAGVAGLPGPAGGPGGVGATSSISGSPVGRAGGGGGNGSSPDGGGSPCGSGTSPGGAAGANRAGGAGGSHHPYTTAGAGSGIVIIRYKFQ